MTSTLSDPKSLTKDKLRKELERLDVALPPPDARKDAYVSLYRRHVLKEKLEFSSDEDLSPGPALTRRVSLTDVNKLTVQGILYTDSPAHMVCPSKACY